MSIINHVYAREILDSRGNPTVEVEVALDTGILGRFAVPSGASTGAYEAHELRDGDFERYKGKGVLSAVQNVNDKISHELLGWDVTQQVAIDEFLIELDGTENKSELGANAILGVSLACARAAADEVDLPLFQYVGGVYSKKLPIPLMNVLNGGAHADNGLDVQEFMLVPKSTSTFKEALRAGSEIFHTLKKILNDKGLATSVGDEGGFAPKLGSNREALQLLLEAIEKAGYRPGDDVGIALDVAATELYEEGKYTWEGKKISSDELAEVYKSWKGEFPLLSIEDGFSEDDWSAWSHFNELMNKGALGAEKLQIVGDDLFVTNSKRLRRGIDENAANALLVKVNQIGTLTETIDAVQLAHNNGYNSVMSHRSGETEDTTIADLAVALGCSQIKTGSLCRSERIAKYNQLLRIEDYLEGTAQFGAPSLFV